MRRLIAPYTRPQYVRTETREEEVDTAIADLVSLAKEARERGLPVWMVLFPTSYRGEIPHWGESFPRWIAALRPLGVRFTGHGLAERSCWGFGDLDHPSEAGYLAITQRVAALIVGGDEPAELAEGRLPITPSCLENAEVGPGKPGVTLPYEIEPRRGPAQPHPPHDTGVRPP